MSEEVKPQLYCDGLLRDCPHCLVARKLMEGYNRVLKGRAVLGTQLDQEGDCHRDSPKVATVGPFRIYCPECKDSGIILTTKGRRLLGVLALWLPDARKEWAAITEEEVTQDAEIPF